MHTLIHTPAPCLRTKGTEISISEETQKTALNQTTIKRLLVRQRNWFVSNIVTAFVCLKFSYSSSVSSCTATTIASALAADDDDDAAVGFF